MIIFIVGKHYFLVYFFISLLTTSFSGVESTTDNIQILPLPLFENNNLSRDMMLSELHVSPSIKVLDFEDDILISYKQQHVVNMMN